MSNYESTHRINNTVIRPENADNIGLSVDWTKNPNEAELTVDSLVLTNNAKTLTQAHWDTLGGFEGLPYTYAVNDPQNPSQSFQLEYFIDFPDNTNFSDSSITVKVRRRKALDKFMQDARGLTFEDLNAKLPGGITGIFNVPYVIIKEEQAMALIMLAITTYNLTKAIIESVFETADAIADVTAALPPVPGNVGAVAAAIIKAAARIVYTIALILALIQLVQQILEILFPKIRYFKASYFSELIRQGCEYLGYNFKSDLFKHFDKLTYLPVPLQKTNKSIFENLIGLQSQSYNKGYPTVNDVGTNNLGSLIDTVLEWFNAKVRVEESGQTVRIERRDWWQYQSGITVKNTLTDQIARENNWTHNWGECWKRYFVHYELDITDTHTLDNVNGLSCEYSTEPITVGNADLVNISGLVEIGIPFALGIRKTKLNFVEKVAYELAQFADSVINTFGGNSDLASKIKGRIGLLQISGQYFEKPKALWTSGGKQPPNYLDRIGANAIYQAQHSINEVDKNFKRIYEGDIPFNPGQFVNLLDNNYLFDEDENQLELLNFEWINENRQAHIRYAVPSDEAKNVKTVLIAA